VQDERVTVRREVAVSAALSVVAVVGIGAASFVVARAAATEEALRQAEQATQLLAAAVIEPALDDDLLEGDADAIADLDTAVQAGVLGDQVLSARVWAPDGTILYTDDLVGIGERFPLGAEELEVLATGQPHAELSDLDKEENAGQADFDQLVEVYTAIQDPDGAPLLFETYQSPDPIAATTGRILRAFAPVVLGGLLLIGLVQALLAWRLARRLEGAQDEREHLLQHALAASEHERRTIAADLHDGVVQDLVGLTYALDAMAEPSGEHGDPGDPARSEALTAAAATTRRSVRSLRSLLVEIYPPNLDQVGLAGAVVDLAAAAGSAGTQVDVRIDPDVVLSEDARAAVYRAIREALSNVRRHARARHARVRLAGGAGGGAVLEVSDDGVGFDPRAVGADHMGLRLLQDLAASVGGRLEVDAGPGRGTTLRMVVP
jgi:signal transduction histidine kinase